MSGTRTAGGLWGRLTGPCTYTRDAVHGGPDVCGSEPTRTFIQGPRCAAHTPNALAGRPELPPTRCAPKRCLCGDPACPAYETYTTRSTYTAAADYEAVVGARHITSGKRRSNLASYRAAQAAAAERKTRQPTTPKGNR
ncbi:hypothetical protein [Actinomadura yumaensis]|uniref:Uncharacterized protein n=1 Tax=Actinomadura yumaensis TaxID=111807 RepID=A0ABW2CP52_9ACTN